MKIEERFARLDERFGKQEDVVSARYRGFALLKSTYEATKRSGRLSASGIQVASKILDELEGR